MDALISNLVIALVIGLMLWVIYELLTTKEHRKKNRAAFFRVVTTYVMVVVFTITLGFSSMFTAEDDGTTPSKRISVDSIEMEPSQVVIEKVEEPTLEEEWEEIKKDTTESSNERKKRFLELD